jgi:hypothetical protein
MLGAMVAVRYPQEFADNSLRAGLATAAGDVTPPAPAAA